MDDAVRMRGVERRRSLREPVERAADGLRSFALEAIGQRPAGEVFHHDVRPAFVLADVEDRDRARRVREPCDSERLAGEATPDRLVVGEPAGEQLDGDDTAEVGVLGPVDLSHAAACDQLRIPVALGKSTLAHHDRLPRVPPPETRESSVRRVERFGKEVLDAGLLPLASTAVDHAATAHCPHWTRSRVRGLRARRRPRTRAHHAGRRDRDDVPRQRPRLGPRRRDEPVRRPRLRPGGLDARADPRPLLHRSRARLLTRRACPRPRRRGEGRRHRPLRGPVPGPRRVREDVSAARRPGDARAEAPRDGERDADRARGADPLPARHGSARGRRPAVPWPDHGHGHGPEARRDQRRRARAVPPGRDRAGDAEFLAGRGVEGTGSRRALVRARAPADRQDLRPLRRRAQPGLRRARRRAPAHDRRRPVDQGPGAALGGEADRRALPLDLRRLDARRGRGLRQAGPVSRRRRRPAQRALARASLGADPGGGEHAPQGPRLCARR